MIELRNVTRRYGAVEALRGISTRIESGQIVGLLGQNGAGKTTTMKILVGYLLPTSGTATVAGFDVTEEPLEVQRRLGYLPENAPLYGEMLAQDYLRFVAEMRDIGRGAEVSRIGAVAEECGIAHVLTRPIGQLSKGYRQRVGLAASIIHDPSILILDEPTSGLDPNQIVEIRDLIRRMGRTKTIILSTHILTEVEQTCDRAVILIDGRIRADGTLDELTHSRAQIVRAEVQDVPAARGVLLDIPGVTAADAVTTEGPTTVFRLDLGRGAEVGAAVYEAARQCGWVLHELRRDDRTLEQVFRDLTAGEEAAA